MQSRKSYLLFFLVCAIFGNTFLAISLGLKAGATPLFLAGLRFSLAGFLMLAGLSLAGRAPLAVLGALAGRSLVLSLFMTVGTFGCMFIAQTRVDSGFMARLDSSGPLVTALFAALFLKKRITPVHLAAFALGMAGAFLIASPAASAEPLFLLFAAASVILYAAANGLYPLLFRSGEDPVLISALQALIGGLILLVLALIFEPVRLPGAALLPFAYLVLGGSVIGHTATLVLIRDAGPVFASGWLYVAPVVASFSGYLVLGERLTPAGMAGTALSLLGVFILDRAERSSASGQCRWDG